MFLIINDDQYRKIDLNMALEKAFPNTSIVAVEHGESGIELIDRFYPKIKLVLSAIYVNGRTGIQIFQEIHNRFPEVEFILTSGLFARRLCKHVGIKYILSRSTPIKKLIEIVKKIIGEKKCPIIA